MEALAQEKKLAGEYYLEGVMETAAGIKLNPDSTFQFFYSYGAADREGKGHWSVQNNEIILNSAKKDGEAFKLEKSEKKSGDFLTVKIKAQKEYQHYFHAALLKGDQFDERQSNEDGEIRFDKMDFDTLALMFAFCPENSSFYKSLDKANNYFVFSMSPWIMEIFFENTVMKIEEDGLKGVHPLFGKREVSFKRNE